MSRSNSFAIFALALGSFAIGLGEFVLMGLLPEVASDLTINIPQAGYAISSYALGVVIGAPALAIISTRYSRTLMLIILMALYALGHLASALAPSYSSLLVIRLISGFPHGTYFGIASLVAASLVPVHQRTQAVGYVMVGLAAAALIGVPVASYLGLYFGWRFSFILVAGFALCACLAIWKCVPYETPLAGARISDQLSVFKNKQVWLALTVGAIGFGGMFAIFSYVKPTLMALAGLSEAGVPWILVLLGLGMMLGNLVGAKMADRDLLGTIKRCLLWSALVCGLYIYTSSHLWLACLTVLAVGTIVAIGPAIQVRLMEVAGKAQTMAAALNHSAFNLANANGAFLGGLVIDLGFGYAATGAVGVVLSFISLGIFYWLAADDKKNKAQIT